MAQPATFENFFRTHDKALMTWLQGLTVDYGDMNGLFGSFKITSLSQSGGTATCVTSAPHGFSMGATFQIRGVAPAAWNTPGTVATVVDATTFTFAANGTPSAGTSFGTVSLARNNTPIISVLASPDRSFAQASDLLKKTGWIPGVGSETADKDLDLFNGMPLPLVSVERTEHDIDNDLLGVPKKIAADNTNTSFYAYWTPYWFYYTLSFWTTKKYTMNFCAEWMESQFGMLGNLGRETYITVGHSNPWGSKRQSLQRESFSDNSDLEGSDPRTFRWDYSLKMRAWLIRPVLT